LRKNITTLKDHGVDVGLWGDQGGGAELGSASAPATVVEYAVYNEFGTSRGIPPRPFMGTTADRHRDQVLAFMGDLAGQVVEGRATTERVLRVLGMHYQSLMRQTVRDSPSWAQENADATKARKESTSPLIDSGTMVRSITFQIV
jgi:phage gpG-like protein